jgi:hypothetical protein
MAVARHSFFIAHRLRERLAEGDADVFHGVVRIDVEIALGHDVDIDQPVARDLVHHVVEEGHPGVETRCAAAIEVDGGGDLGLEGIAGDGGLACSHVVLQLAKFGIIRDRPRKS